MNALMGLIGDMQADEEVVIDDGSGGGLISVFDPLTPVMPRIPARPALPPRTVTHTLPPGTTANSISGWLQTSTAILGVAIPNFVLLAGAVVGAVFLSKGK